MANKVILKRETHKYAKTVFKIKIPSNAVKILITKQLAQCD